MNPDSFHTAWSAVKKYFSRLLDFFFSHHQHIITFLFFVFLSSLFWLFRSLSLDYEDEILYPVRYINIPENKVMTNKLPEKLALKVKANGRRILLGKLNLNLIPLKFDVNSFITKTTHPDSLYILTNSVKEILSGEMEGVNIISISPDTLFFNFTTMEVKRVAVRPRYSDPQQMFAPQYMINGPVIVEPDSIIISGPASQLHDITSVSTEPLNFAGLNDTMSRTIGLEKREGISYSQKKVFVTVPVDQYTQAEYYLPVVALNVPDSLSVKTFPERIRITFNITLSNYQKIIPERISPRIDYDDILKNPTGRIRLFLADTPEIISTVKFSPEKVEYLLTRQ